MFMHHQRRNMQTAGLLGEILYSRALTMIASGRVYPVNLIVLLVLSGFGRRMPLKRTPSDLMEIILTVIYTTC